MMNVYVTPDLTLVILIMALRGLIYFKTRYCRIVLLSHQARTWGQPAALSVKKVGGYGGNKSLQFSDTGDICPHAGSQDYNFAKSFKMVDFQHQILCFWTKNFYRKNLLTG